MCRKALTTDTLQRLFTARTWVSNFENCRSCIALIDVGFSPVRRLFDVLVEHVGLVVVLSALLGCATPEIPKAHNDPNKYAVAEDVLWGLLMALI